MDKIEKKISIRAKTNLYTMGSIISLILPVLVAVGINFEEYFIRRSGGLKVGFGGMLALILVILLAKGKSEALRGVWGYLIAFILAVCLQPILDDIILLTGMALAGKAIDSFTFAPKLKRLKAMQANEQQADVLGNSLRAVFAEQIKLLGGRDNE